MYINDLGMRDETGRQIANTANVNTVSTNNGSTINTAGTKVSGVKSFPTELKSAVENQNVSSVEDKDAALSIEEALARLKNDPEWEDVGTALAAMYKNQQQMQVQMNLLSAGYSSGFSSLYPYSVYGLGSNASLAYRGTANLLGSSIFGDMLL